MAGVGATEAWWPGRPGLGALAVALCVAAVAGVFLRSRRPAAVLVLFCLAGLARGELPAPQTGAAGRAQAWVGQIVVAEGTAAADPRPTADGYEVLMDVTRVSSSGGPIQPFGRLLVRSRLGSPPAPGDGLTVTGRLRLPSESPGFDRRAYLAQRGAWLELVAGQVNTAPAGSWLGELPARVRSAYRGAIADSMPPPHSALLVGIVLGIRAGVPHQLEQDLIATGLVHLLVLSGLKVAVFARLASAALDPLLGRWSTLPVLGLVALYALVGGATPAAVRAAGMGALALLGARLGRPAQVWTSLALAAAVMLAWEPGLVLDTGFLLSFLGTAAIVLWTPAIESRLQRIPKLFREPLAVTLAAQIGTLPVTAAGFHLLSPVAPIANALTLPLLPFLVVGGLLLGPLAMVPVLGRAAALPLAGLLVYLEQVAGLLARLPGAALATPGLPKSAGLAYYAAVGGSYGALRSGGRTRLLALGLAAGIPLALAAAELGAWSRSAPTATVLDVGDGQAVLAGGPDGWILLDGGPTPARLANELGTRLPPWNGRLDALFLTAPGAGHVGGLTNLQYDVGTVFLPATGPGGNAARSVALAVAARGARIGTLVAGESFSIAGLRIEILAPEAADPVGESGAGYLAVRIVGPGGKSFCDLSDLDPDAQLQAAARLHGPCDALLLPAAGRSLPAPELLARAGRGDLVISAAAARPARGLPASRLRRTDQEGAISFQL